MPSNLPDWYILILSPNGLTSSNNWIVESIFTFVDRRYFQGNLYKQLGFEFKGYTKPNYWYYKKNDLIKIHPSNFKKDILVKQGFDPNKTEFEIMDERGFLRIYDCGNIKFELKI